MFIAGLTLWCLFYSLEILPEFSKYSIKGDIDRAETRIEGLRFYEWEEVLCK